eukprot:9926662-Heterocapsa_arctica.AAC.1
MPAENIDSVINADTGNEDERASFSHETINMIMPADNADSVINADTVIHISEDENEEDEVKTGQ